MNNNKQSGLETCIIVLCVLHIKLRIKMSASTVTTVFL